MSSRQIQEAEVAGRRIELIGRAEGEPEFYVDGIHGVQSTGPSIKLNFYTVGIDSSATHERRESVCRLVLTTPQFFQMADFLTQLTGEMRRAAQQARERPPTNPAPAATSASS